MVLNELAKLAESALQPEGRAMATANTLRQQAEWAADAGLDVSEPDLKAAFAALSLAQGDDEPGPVIGRRNTCGELAGLLEGEGGDPAACVSLWEGIHASAASAAEAAGGDPRLEAIASTSGREAGELRSL